MTSTKVFYIAAKFNQVKKCLLTIKEKEMLIFINEILQENAAADFSIMQYHTTMEGFKKDLQQLTSEVIRGA